MNDADTKTYASCLSIGNSYQEFVINFLNEKFGWGISNYKTYYEQIHYGENSVGFEIKFDRQYHKTGNLFIETNERTHTQKDYVASGIFRNDNTWLYFIGDYSTIFVFSKKQLQIEQSKRRIIEIKKCTAMGFLLPVKHCPELCLKIFNIES